MKKIIQSFKQYIAITLLSSVILVMITGLQLYMPFLFSKLIDNGIVHKDFNLIKKISMQTIGILVVSVTLLIINIFIQAKVSFGFSRLISEKIFNKIQYFSAKTIDKFKISSLISRVTNDTNNVSNLFFSIIPEFFEALFVFVFSFVYAYKINEKWTFQILLLIPVILLFGYFISRKIEKIFTQVRKLSDNINRKVKQTVSSIKLIKSFNLEKSEFKKFSDINEEIMDKTIKGVNIIIGLTPIINILIYSVVAFVVYSSKTQILVGDVGIGSIISFIIYALNMLSSVVAVVSLIITIFQTKISITRISEILNEEIDEQIYNTTDLIKYNSKYDIEFKNVYFKYEEAKNFTLKNISFKIEEGENIGIIGFTGSGKTTLIETLLGIYDVTDGNIYIGGIDISKYDKKYLTSLFSYVLQEKILFTGTIKENVLYGKNNANEKEILEAIKDAELYDYVKNMKLGIDTLVSEAGSNLSGGQKQRLSIARALIKKAKINIFDDATSAIDLITERAIWNNLNKKNKQSINIIISQRISTIEHCDKIIVMNDGCIENIGTHDELINNSHIYKEIYINQYENKISKQIAISDEKVETKKKRRIIKKK